MRTRGILAVMALCAASVGCSDFMSNACRNLSEWPFQVLDDARMVHRNHRRAEEAWRLISDGSKKDFSKDFADGFIAGYADYLTFGGNGEPPAVPPFRYQKVRYQTPEGVEEIDQWYAGWHHGALMAKASGQRELEVIPLSAPPINAVERDYGPPIQLPPTAAQLPAPHPLPAPQPNK